MTRCSIDSVGVGGTVAVADEEEASTLTSAGASLPS
jgi:hypothetical protein